jgi:hypothetical protein
MLISVPKETGIDFFFGFFSRSYRRSKLGVFAEMRLVGIRGAVTFVNKVDDGFKDKKWGQNFYFGIIFGFRCRFAESTDKDTSILADFGHFRRISHHESHIKAAHCPAMTPKPPLGFATH